MKKQWLLLFMLLLFGICIMSCGNQGDEISDTEPVITEPETTDPEITESETTKPEITEPATTKPETTEPEAFFVKEAANILKIPNGAKAIITITHDDGTMATVEFLDEQYRKNNLRGTVCLIAKNFVTGTGDVNDAVVKKWAPFFESGRFDVACHTYTHTFMGKTDQGDTGLVLYSNVDQRKVSNQNATIPAGNLTKEIVTSREVLMECFPEQRVLAFVKAGTPGYKDETGKFIQISPDAMELIKENYIIMRNTTGGLKGAALVEDIPAQDIYNVHSLQVSPSQTGKQWKQYVDWAIEKNGWMTYLFHQIVDDAKAGGINVGKTAAAELFAYVGEKAASGEVWCAFLSEAAQYTEEYRCAKGTLEISSNLIKVTVTDTLNDALYDYPLTVLVNVPADWTEVTLTHADGTTETLRSFVDGDKTSVYVNVVPDSGTATLRKVN